MIDFVKKFCYIIKKGVCGHESGAVEVIRDVLHYVVVHHILHAEYLAL